MTARLDERQAKSFPEKIGDLHSFLSEATAAATLLHLCHKFRLACGWITKTRSDGGCIVRGGNHQKRYGKDLGYHTNTNINEGEKKESDHDS